MHLNLLRRITIRSFSKKYAKSHEWIMKNPDNSFYRVGISDNAQNQLGGVVYIGFPDVYVSFEREEVFGEIESPKAVSNLYAPVDLKIVNINEELAEDYGVVNEDAENTWIIETEITNENQLNDLMSEEEYQKFLEEEG